jgi:hypothetical protein
VLGFPFHAAPPHDAGFDVAAARKPAQRALVGHSGKTRERAAHEERALLPMAAQKVTRRESAEQSQVHREKL